MIQHRLIILFVVGIWISTIAAAVADDPLTRAERREHITQCRDLLKESLRRIEQEDSDSALALLEAARECDPKNPDVYYHAARVLLRKSDTLEAISQLSFGVEKAPLSTRLRLLLSRLLIARRAVGEAEEHIDRVLAIKPREGEALYLKGLIHMANGDSTGALEIWQNALENSLTQIPH